MTETHGLNLLLHYFTSDVRRLVRLIFIGILLILGVYIATTSPEERLFFASIIVLASYAIVLFESRRLRTLSEVIQAGLKVGNRPCLICQRIQDRLDREPVVLTLLIIASVLGIINSAFPSQVLQFAVKIALFAAITVLGLWAFLLDTISAAAMMATEKTDLLFKKRISNSLVWFLPYGLWYISFQAEMAIQALQEGALASWIAHVCLWLLEGLIVYLALVHFPYAYGVGKYKAKELDAFETRRKELLAKVESSPDSMEKVLVELNIARLDREADKIRMIPEHPYRVLNVLCSLGAAVLGGVVAELVIGRLFELIKWVQVSSAIP